MTNASSKVRAPPSVKHNHLPYNQIFSFNPTSQTVRLESSRSNKLLMRRYAMVQKAKDADVFGILVGTLGVGKSFQKFNLVSPSSPSVSPFQNNNKKERANACPQLLKHPTSL